MKSLEISRCVADLRRLRAVLAEVHNGIDRARREFGDDMIVTHAKLANVADALARSERITLYLKHLQQQVLERQTESRLRKAG